MVYDISPPIMPDLAVWPGDTPPAREVLLDMQLGDYVTLSTLRTTVHLGAHADAPSHCAANAPTIDIRPLELYLGPCQVVRVAARRGMRIGAAELPLPIRAERLLIATGTFPDPSRFNRDFAAFAPELIDFVHQQGVCLLGIDTPSFDLEDSRDLPAHRRAVARDVAILEGLVLAGVPEGQYELIALPLPLVGFDASPVRAVLRTIE